MKEIKINIQNREIIILQDDDGFFIKPEIVVELEKQGTATKPAHEPICMARKPLEKGLTIAENVLKYRAGGINIDISRVGTDDNTGRPSGNDPGMWAGKKQMTSETHPQGRFPANLILSADEDGQVSEEVRECFPKTVGAGNKIGTPKKSGTFFTDEQTQVNMKYDNGGSTARFFKSIIYQAKASKKDRGEGNFHATVKPVALMEYLINMVTPKDGTILDPFAGSGTTGVAAIDTNRNAILIEREEKYCEIIRARINAAKPERTLFDD